MEAGDTVKLNWDCMGWLKDDQGEIVRLIGDHALIERYVGSPTIIEGIKVPQNCVTVVV